MANQSKQTGSINNNGRKVSQIFAESLVNNPIDINKIDRVLVVIAKPNEVDELFGMAVRTLNQDQLVELRDELNYQIELNEDFSFTNNAQ